VDGVTILLGIAIGIHFGSLTSAAALFETWYGRTFLCALVLASATWFFGENVTSKRAEKIGTSMAADRPTAVRRTFELPGRAQQPTQTRHRQARLWRGVGGGSSEAFGMPRTPLFATLRRLARDVADGSDRLESLPRGTFIKGAAALPIAAALAPSPLAAAVSAKRRVAIVGAGISGLIAALTLREAGLSPRLFEASGRSGGRIHTNRAGWFGGQTAEWCGELIDSSHTTMLALAKRFGLPLTDVLAGAPPGAQYTIFLEGTYYPIAQAARDFKPVFGALQAQLLAAGDLAPYDKLNAEQRRLDALSVFAWIERYVPGGHASLMGRYIERAYLAEFGRDTREQSAINIVYMLGTQSGAVAGETGFHIFGPSDERYHIAGGNERLTDAIAAHLPAGTIRLGTRLETIARDPDGLVTLTVASDTGRERHVFDRVILALPFTRLRHVDYRRAGFSAVKRTAIERLGYARHTKMHIPFSSRVWRARGPWPGISDGTVFTDLDFQNAWDTTRGQPGKNGILVAYPGGAAAIGETSAGAAYATSYESPEARRSVERVVAQIERIFPGSAKHYAGNATVGRTFLDPFIGGSYSVWLVGQLTAFGGCEGRSEGPIHFAGEHTSLTQQGYMEGGAATGIRAAHEVLYACSEKTRERDPDYLSDDDRLPAR
jgi:monoamine oxidase